MTRHTTGSRPRRVGRTSLCTLVVAASTLLSGCTVGWYQLRAESSQGPIEDLRGEACPGRYSLSLASSYSLGSYGTKAMDDEIVSEKTENFRATTNEVFQATGCRLNEDSETGSDPILVIRVEENQQLSALPQEYLTGLSFGVIPSWGDRRAELRFVFKLGRVEAVYEVDERRINHLVLLPFTWTSFLLIDDQREYEKALRDFLPSPRRN